MTVTAVLEPIAAPDAVRKPIWMTGWRLGLLWILSGICLMACLGGPPVTRTQEARVLETAREMLDEPGKLDNWLIPELNGVARLRKPPLPYWFSAVAFMVGGVNETVGRIPTAFLGWLLIGLTFRIADRLLDRRKAFFSAGALAASYLFFRHARLAETDMPAALFATMSIGAFLRAAEDRRIIWHHIAAIGIGLAANAKGAPALYPLAFLVAYALIEKRWDVPLRFVTSGAILVALLIGGAWYVYAGASHGLRQFQSEMQEAGTGEGHKGPPYFYIAQLQQAAAPWSLLAIAGIICAAARWRSSPPLRFVLIWFFTLLIVLSVVPQKQAHYALPMLPPLMVLAGLALDLACGGLAPPAGAGRRGFPLEAVSGESIPSAGIVRPDVEAHIALRFTLIGIAIAAIAGPVFAAYFQLHQIRTSDWIVSTIMTAMVATALLIWFKLGKTAGATALLVSIMLALPLLQGFWYPGLSAVDERDIAAKARQLRPQGPFVFYAEMHLPLVFYLQTPVPMVDSPKKLEATIERLVAANESPPLIIAGGKTDEPKEPFQRPPMELDHWKLQKDGEVRTPSHLFEMYRVEKR